MNITWNNYDFSINDLYLHKAQSIEIIGTNFSYRIVLTIAPIKNTNIINYLPLSININEPNFLLGIRNKGNNEILMGRTIDRMIRPVLKSLGQYEIQIDVFIMEKSKENLLFILIGISYLLYKEKLINTLILPIFHIDKGLNQNIIGSIYDNKIISINGNINMNSHLLLEIIKNNITLNKDLSNQLIQLLSLSKSNNKWLSLIEEEKDKKQQIQKNMEKIINNFSNLSLIADNKTLNIHEKDCLSKIFMGNLIDQGKRLDGRAFDECRPLLITKTPINNTYSVNVVRGKTNGFVTMVLVNKLSNNRNNFRELQCNYKLLPLSTGETGKYQFYSRRDIGHGNIVEESLSSIFSHPVFNIVGNSTIFGAHGSTSMVSLIGLSYCLYNSFNNRDYLMSGVSVGISRTKNNTYLLLDITEEEDFFYNMDFKIISRGDKIIYCQLDVKDTGITLDELLESLTLGMRANNDNIDNYTLHNKDLCTSLTLPMDNNDKWEKINKDIDFKNFSITLLDKALIIHSDKRQDLFELQEKICLKYNIKPLLGYAYLGNIFKIDAISKSTYVYLCGREYQIHYEEFHVNNTIILVDFTLIK